jgi:poly(A) polymerase
VLSPTARLPPPQVTRYDFFDSLKAILEDHDSVENLSAIESAAVPMIAFEFDGVDIDLLFASVPLDALPKDWDINDDSVLRGVDLGTEKSLNGPRVTNLIEKLVPHFDAFVLVVRCVRYWAKRRGLYANKMGYLGGVNWNILCAFVCQLYPNAAPSLLLERFFFILSEWKWPTPIQITPQYDAGLGFETWEPVGGNRFHTMPILTPACTSRSGCEPSTSDLVVPTACDDRAPRCGQTRR